MENLVVLLKMKQVEDLKQNKNQRKLERLDRKIKKKQKRCLKIYEEQGYCENATRIIDQYELNLWDCGEYLVPDETESGNTLEIEKLKEYLKRENYRDSLPDSILYFPRMHPTE